MPLVEPTDFLLEEMLTNGIDSLFLQVAHLPRVQVRAILPSTLTTLAPEVDTYQLSHSFGENVRSLHIWLFKEKHSHVTDVALGSVSS